MDRPTLRQLSYAVALADHQHFGHAADSEHVSQPGLSGQIQELERRVGVQLFERSHRKVELTTAGADLVERARVVLRNVDDLMAATSMYHDSMRGMLRIGAIPTMAPYLLPALVHTAASLWPDVELGLQELQTITMVSALEQGDLDVGLLAMPVDTGTLHVAPIGEEPFALVVPNGHRLDSPEPFDIASLAGESLVLLEEGHCLRDHAISSCHLDDGSQRNIVQAASMSTLTQMVAAGLGVTLLPQSALSVETRPGTGVSVRPLIKPAPGREIALAWRSSDPRHDHFVEAAAAFRAAIESDLGAP